MRATSKATRVTKEIPAHRGRKDRKGPPGQQDPEVPQALPGHRDRKAPPGQQDPEVPQALLAHRGRKAPPERVALHQVAATGCAFQMERRSAGTSSIQTEAIIHGHFRWHFLIRDILLLVALSHSFRLFVRTKARHHAHYLDVTIQHVIALLLAAGGEVNVNGN